MSRLSAGDPAPTFTLHADDGTEVNLKQFRGKRVVIYFYPADDTPGCTTEACQFNDSLAQFAALDVPVIGISPDDGESHRAFRLKYSLGFTLLSDPTHDVMAAYGAYGEKTLYGKKVIGVIRSTFLIDPQGLIERAWYGPRTDGHARRVFESL